MLLPSRKKGLFIEHFKGGWIHDGRVGFTIPDEGSDGDLDEKSASGLAGHP
jgi:hypothetical protein